MAALTARDINAAIVDQGVKQLLVALLASGQLPTPQAGPAELTDSTAGTPSTTALAAIPAAVASTGADTTAATVASVNASLASVRNDFATLNALINALLTKLVAAGVFSTT